MGIKQYLREITLSMMFLQEQIDMIDSYPDKSLFFQNPQIIEGWVKLVKATDNKKVGYDPESVKNWLQRTETYVGYLITLRKLNILYKSLELKNLDQMSKLLDFYSGWEKREFINADLVKSLSGGQYLGILNRDITQNYKELNRKLLHARSNFRAVVFEDINNFLLALMNRIRHNLMSMNPTFEDLSKAIDNDLREWTKHFGNKLIRDMKEDLNRHYKDHRTDHNTPELWSEMLDADEDALNMAKRQQLTECNKPKQEHWGEDMKKQMDENGRLMQQILSSCRSDELLDLGKEEVVELFIPLLTPDNLDMFYEIIVRRSLIQCEMFPELKIQHNAWLNKTVVQPEVSIETGLDAVRQSKTIETTPKIIEDSENETGDDEEALVAKLKPIFYNEEENARRFLKEIKGMAAEGITDLVNRWVKDKLISNYGNSRKGVLWGLLHDAKLYTKTKSNWNGRVI